MLESQRLLVFVEVAHTGSIAGAARRLRFTPSAVSQQISKLEAEIGQALLVRQARGVRLTEAGQVLLEHSEPILADLEAAQAAARSVAVEGGSITVATFASAGWAFVPPALSRFVDRHPTVSLRLLDVEPPAGYGEVRAGEIDLLVTHCYVGLSLPPDRGLIRELMIDEPLWLVGSRQKVAHHVRSASTSRVVFAALADVTWISGAPGTPSRESLVHLADRAGVALHVAYETEDYRLMVELARAGLGLAVVPRTVAKTIGHDLASVAIDGEPSRRIFLIRRRRSTPLLDEMVTSLRLSSEQV